MSDALDDASPTGLGDLPSNLLGETRVLFCLGAVVQNRPVSEDLAALPLHEASPIRRFYSWPGKRNYEGFWWSSTLGRHIQFESLLERSYLETADLDRRVVGIASQPLAFLWPKGTKGMRSHVPDFIVKLDSGSSRLVDVKAPGRVDASAAQFAATRVACDEIGWEYEVFTGLPEPLASNVSWLSAYRHDRYRPDEAVREACLAVFGGDGRPMGAGVRSVVRAARTDRAVAHSAVLFLMHEGVLQVDLSEPLSLDTIVKVAP